MLLLLPFAITLARAASDSIPGNATAALNQLQTAFSSGNPVTSVLLNGTAAWHSGGSQETGTVTLQVASTGAAQLQLSLPSSGVRKESQTSIDAGMSCQWSAGGAPIHAFAGSSCWKPIVWFLPAISLQPKMLSANIGVADYGIQNSNGSALYHLQAQMVVPDPSSSVAVDNMQGSTTDIRLDPKTFLPAGLSYTVHADDGSSALIMIEVRYSNYQATGGVNIPFLIQRYVNGSLQFEIAVQSAQINSTAVQGE